VPEVYLHGTGIIPFGRYPDRSLEELAVPAATEALAESALEPADVAAVYCGNVYGGMLPAHRIAACLGLTSRPRSMWRRRARAPRSPCTWPSAQSGQVS
jgi:benzoylsuccinyl-CoA thiolase BbsB subunit